MKDTLEVLNHCKGIAGAVLVNSGSAFSAEDAALYLAHTDRGASIRALASVTGTHPSTVMRRIQKIESRREDPLMDKVLAGLETGPRPLDAVTGKAVTSRAPEEAEPVARDNRKLKDAARRYLRRLSEPGAFLMIADGAAKGGIFCAANHHRKPIAMLEARLASAFLLQDWIKLSHRGAVSTRYVLTDVGRSSLKRLLSEEKFIRSVGFAEAQSAFRYQHQTEAHRVFADPKTGLPDIRLVNLGESPVGWLSRRKGPDGLPFLAPEEVEAAERLRTDFEAAQMGPSIAQDWRKFLTPSDKRSGSPTSSGPGEGPQAARDRVAAALSTLGPGLSDVAIRICCFLEGLETCERRMGWSARSAKVVLKIALQRLAVHYGMIVFKH